MRQSKGNEPFRTFGIGDMALTLLLLVFGPTDRFCGAGGEAPGHTIIGSCPEGAFRSKNPFRAKEIKPTFSLGLHPRLHKNGPLDRRQCLVAWLEPITSIEEMPPIDRLAADFYGAIGDGRTGVAATWNAEWDGSDIALSLTIQHAVNPTELTAPDLSEMAMFKEKFQFLGAVQQQGSTFRWNLRPRDPFHVEIPSLKVRYYVPGLPEGERFRTTYADAVTLDRPAPVIVDSMPIPKFTPTTFVGIRVSLWAWLIVLGFVPLFVLAWVGIDRKFFASRAILRRNRAVREALAQLNDAKNQPDEAERVSAILWRYCVDRHHLPTAARTPTEIAEGLHQLGYADEWVIEIERLLRECDAVRFRLLLPSPLGGEGLGVRGTLCSLLKLDSIRQALFPLTPNPSPPGARGERGPLTPGPSPQGRGEKEAPSPPTPLPQGRGEKEAPSPPTPLPQGRGESIVDTC